MSSSTYKLLRNESTGLKYVGSVTTLTHYRGHVPVDFLRSRVTEIIRSNTWLVGRLKSSGMDVVLHCDNVVPEMNRHFEVVEVSLRGDEAFDELGRKFDRFGVKRGLDCIDADEALFRVTVVQSAGRKEFFLVVSLSHVLGDGFTFYRLYAMLDAAGPVLTLKFERVLDFSDQLKGVIGGSAYEWARSPLMLLSVLFSSSFRSVPAPRMVRIDNNWLAAEKQRYLERKVVIDAAGGDSADFVSSNDILTSWLLNLCKAPMGCLAVNYRNRVPTVSDDYAGNYEAIITLNTPNDFALPEDIRYAVQRYHCKSCVAPPSYLFDWYGYFNMALCTNWAGLYHHIHMPVESSCEHIIHMPLVKIRNECFSPHVMIIFRFDEHQLGVLTASHAIESVHLQAAGTLMESAQC